MDERELETHDLGERVRGLFASEHGKAVTRIARHVRERAERMRRRRRAVIAAMLATAAVVLALLWPRPVVPRESDRHRETTRVESPITTAAEPSPDASANPIRQLAAEPRAQ